MLPINFKAMISTIFYYLCCTKSLQTIMAKMFSVCSYKNVLELLIRTWWPLPTSPINNKPTCLLKEFFDTLAIQFLFFNFVNISNFDRLLYVLKIKFSSETFVHFPDSDWIMICRIQMSDQTQFTGFVIIDILNIDNWTLIIWHHNCYHLRVYTLK